MQKRRVKHARTKRSTFTKITIAIILFLTITLGSFSVLAADGSIPSILNDWFSKQEKENIAEIDKSITDAQEEQTARLKETLRGVIDNQREELDQFLESEKKKRSDALEEYADELIEEFKSDHENENENEKQQHAEELDVIMEDAIEQMDAVTEEAENNMEENAVSDKNKDYTNGEVKDKDEEEGEKKDRSGEDNATNQEE